MRTHNTNVVQFPEEYPKVLFLHRSSKITNVSAIWRPTAPSAADATGRTAAYIAFIAQNGDWLKAGLFSNEDGHFYISLGYSSSPRKCIAPPESLPKGDVYFEIDVDTKNSGVVFWINGRGLDMGTLPGFEGGAQQVTWGAHAGKDAYMIGGRFTDCAFATASGWTACDLGRCDVGHENLKDHHHVEMLSSDSFAIGDKRLMA